MIKLADYQEIRDLLDLDADNKIDGYDKINVVLGKNGSGKSRLLRLMDEKLSGHGNCVRYITPERGGELRHDGNVETTSSRNPTWLTEARRRNRFDQFRESSVMVFRNLEALVLRQIESNQEIRASSFTFDTEIADINSLLDRVELIRTDTADFEVLRRHDNQPAQVQELSSGESELISLAFEILYFCYLCKIDKHVKKDNWLLLDEPDVHIHPDLQHRLMKLLVDRIRNVDGRVAVATHSTAILSSMYDLGVDAGIDVRVGFMQFGMQKVSFRSVDDPMRSILPVFGAHPLSNVFNEKPPLIVEGEDDERIWQAAVRSSQGRISVFPCVAGGIQSLNGYEEAARRLIGSVYDDARAFSLRDKDDEPYEIGDLGPVIRCRLACRNAENLIVSDDVLDDLGTSWDALREALEKWIEDNPEHPQHADAVAFRDGNWNRKEFPLKSLRMILVGITGSTKPWEVAVGRAIARLPENRFSGSGSLKEYLGPKLIEALELEG